jgi:hypothetical protein
MKGVPIDEPRLLLSAVGRSVKDLHRTYFLCEDELDRSEGDLTVSFSDGKLLRFTGQPTGYGVRIETSRSADLFEGDLDEESRRFVEEHGRYVEVRVSDEQEWRPYIGQKLLAVGELIYRDHGARAGYLLHFSSDLTLCVYNLADEVRVEHALITEQFAEHPITPS